MLQKLLSISTRLKALADALAAGITTIIDAVGTRAPSSTALSNATWTDGKAVFLDVGISSRLAALASIQYGTVSITGINTVGTATVSAVTLSKSILIMLGSSTTAASLDHATARITLTNSTTITANRGSGAGGQTVTVSFCLVQFG